MRAGRDSMKAPAPVIAGSIVADVMLQCPKVLPANAAVAQVRAALEDDHVHMVLLTRGTLLRGTIVRGDIPPTASPSQSALRFARLSGRTVRAAAPADAVMRWLVTRQQRRLAVVGLDGVLVGLLCLNARGNGFCSDVNVAARASARAYRSAGPTSQPRADGPVTTGRPDWTQA